MSTEDTVEGSASDPAPKTHNLCQHFVKRKKRLCRMIPTRGGKYCGEHLPVNSGPTTSTDDTSSDKSADGLLRITCPLDPKHTIYASKLTKHLKICNAARNITADYIVPGLNAGDPVPVPAPADFRLTDIDAATIERIVAKVSDLYTNHDIDGRIDDLIETHPVLADEMNKPEYGFSALKHLTQISAILGYLEYYKELTDRTSYVEYGAGKGQVSFWLAKCLDNYKHSNVLLIDRASLRHKRDNKLADTHAVERIRVDIADFDVSKYETIQRSQRMVAMGKHLCGGATDFAIRCILHGNNVVDDGQSSGPKTNSVFIALCCHHRCTWNTFTGKDFFTDNGIEAEDFRIITKMAGWATCGTGFSREKRKQMADADEATISVIADGEQGTTSTDAGAEQNGDQDEDHGQNDNQTAPDNANNKYDFTERKRIGDQCKRLIDYARIQFLEQNGYKCALKRYVSADITPENICLVAFLNDACK